MITRKKPGLRLLAHAQIYLSQKISVISVESRSIIFRAEAEYNALGPSEVQNVSCSTSVT